MKIEGVDHIHIVVKDIDKATEFFCDLFSTKVGFAQESVEFGFRWRYLPIGNVILELMQPTSSDSTFTRFLESRGEGVHAISIKVPDIDKAIAKMKARGVRMLNRVDRPWGKEVLFHPKDTFGFAIELCEHEGGVGEIQAAKH